MRKTNREFRLLILSGMCVVMASCSVADKDVTVAQAQTKKVVAVKTVATASSKAKTYAFPSSEPVAVAMQEERGASPMRENRSAYLGSAPYICSPSGFGRKASCFLR